MKIDLCNIVNLGETIAVAVSGGSDSMALLYFMRQNAKKYGFNVIAINVEHGIRGASSIDDSNFVKSYCRSNGIELLSYSVDAVKKAKSEKLSIEQAGRLLRYECFFDAINSGKCDKVATAHHRRDNVESVLLNLFRGTGLKGVAGINANYSDKIIRPFLSVTKEEIVSYMAKNSIPYITDETNFSDDYTRNYIRLNVLPKIKDAFPEVEKAIARFAQIAKDEDDFLDSLANDNLFIYDDRAEISISAPKPIFHRAVIKGLRGIGVEKDWEKSHIDAIFSLTTNENSSKVSLPKGIIAVREYDKIVIYKEKNHVERIIPFNVGMFYFNKAEYSVTPCALDVDLKSGLYVDLDKIPANAVIRSKKEGDVFTKFGGGTKKLNDFLTDKKIPTRVRGDIPVIACDNVVLAIFGVAVSNNVKVDSTTTNIVKLINK